MIDNQQTVVELVKAAMAEKFAPAIDFRAPYAKVMLDMAARAVIETMRNLPDMGNAPNLLAGLWGRRNIEAFVEDALNPASYPDAASAPNI